MTTSLVVIADGGALQGSRRDRGIARYVSEFLQELAKHPDVTLKILVRPNFFPPDLSSELSRYWRTSEDIDAELEDFNGVPTTYLICSPFQTELVGSELIPEWVAKRGVHVCAFLYDLIPHLRANKYLGSKEASRSYYARLSVVLTADDVFCDSQSARLDLIREFSFPSERVHAIGAGVNLNIFSPQNAKAASAKLRNFCLNLQVGNRRIVSYVAGEDERKNVAGLIIAWGLLPLKIRDTARLVVVCSVSDETRERWTRLAESCGLSERDFLVTGLVSEQELLAIYGVSVLHVMPSLYEGFGLPVAEAAACGVPSICGNNSSLPEVLGEMGTYFDAADPIAISRCIETTLSSDDELAKLKSLVDKHQSQFSWHRPCQEFIDQTMQRATPVQASENKYIPLDVFLPPLQWGGPLIRHALSDMRGYSPKFFDSTSRRDRSFARPFVLDPLTSNHSIRVRKGRPLTTSLIFVANSIDFSTNIEVAVNTRAILYLLDAPPIDTLKASPEIEHWVRQRIASSAGARSVHLGQPGDELSRIDFETMGLSLIEDLISNARIVIVESHRLAERVRRVANFREVKIEVIPLPKPENVGKPTREQIDIEGGQVIDNNWETWSLSLAQCISRLSCA